MLTTADNIYGETAAIWMISLEKASKEDQAVSQEYQQAISEVMYDLSLHFHIIPHSSS